MLERGFFDARREGKVGHGRLKSLGLPIAKRAESLVLIRLDRGPWTLFWKVMSAEIGKSFDSRSMVGQELVADLEGL